MRCSVELVKKQTGSIKIIAFLSVYRDRRISPIVRHATAYSLLRVFITGWQLYGCTVFEREQTNDSVGSHYRPSASVE